MHAIDTTHCARISSRLLHAGWLLTICLTASAQVTPTGTDVMRVEEDWKLVIGDPDPENDSPQITCAISPVDMNTAYCAFDVNYWTQPEYSSGGLQLHTWDPDDPTAVIQSQQRGGMHSSGESVTWTQTMKLQDGRLKFQITNGSSDTWGAFGGDDDSLRLTISTRLSNLNRYDPAVSIKNSGVSYGGNRVDSLTLTAIRYYDGAGRLIQQLTTPMTAHPQN